MLPVSSQPPTKQPPITKHQNKRTPIFPSHNHRDRKKSPHELDLKKNPQTIHNTKTPRQLTSGSSRGFSQNFHSNFSSTARKAIHGPQSPGKHVFMRRVDLGLITATKHDEEGENKAERQRP